ncbi:3615_t:CDS:2 [Acaulospora colombiana]|uniref:3615_t:CDS:1 n=1 Tax=Acaulospora colombiana TaxID=27376 RepID=A0ACA9M322_9GLOM|nr:3615_t:CDS:2 [Acaulospora colombiana]
MPATGNQKRSIVTPPTSSAKISSTTKKANPKDDDTHHIDDLIKTPPSVKIIPILTYMSYVSLTIRNLLSTLIFNWSMAFTYPLNFFLLITLVPLLSIALLVIEMTLQIGFALGLGKVLDVIGHKWGEDLTPINWWDPKMFSSDTIGIVNDGISALERPLPEASTSFRNVVFNIDIAELLLLMSSIIYERNDKVVHDVYNMMTETHSTDKDLKLAVSRLEESESRIHIQAKLWGLEFISLTELNCLGGPFSGMFCSKEHNFIVVVFKGTTPTDFSDYVIDLMLQRVDASNYVFGEIHEGIYTNLFSQAKIQGVKMNPTSPYITIVEAIRAKAASIVKYRVKKTRVNVWITGHSLGGALASVFFARCLKSPEDLGPNCILRDGYMFGCPAIGNSKFASMFSSYSNQPFDRPSTLWRVVNDTDIIAHLSGFEDITVSQALNKYSLLDYTHVGEEIRFFRSGAKPKSTKDVFRSTSRRILVTNDKSYLSTTMEALLPRGNPLDGELFRQSSDYVKGMWKKACNNPLEYVAMLIPAFYGNHIPAEYFKVMQKARKYFDAHSIG